MLVSLPRLFGGFGLRDKWRMTWVVPQHRNMASTIGDLALHWSDFGFLDGCVAAGRSPLYRTASTAWPEGRFSGCHEGQDESFMLPKKSSCSFFPTERSQNIVCFFGCHGARIFFWTSPTVDSLRDKTANARNFGSLAGWKFLQFCGMPCWEGVEARRRLKIHSLNL